MNPGRVRPTDVAVIGMSGRFPGARTIAEFWDNVRHKRETISRFTQADAQESGVDPQAFAHPAFVNAGGVLDDIDQFDAGFFGFNARDAEITDPQHRLFLECAWEALEDGGYDPARVKAPIGVFGGMAMSRYVFNLYSRPDLMAAVGPLQVLLANDKDHLTTRTAYKLNLSGPAVTVQTACSTSLVAIVLAYQQLLDFHCDLALAGGVTIIVPQKTGYFYQAGGISSPDGHCRAFDAAAMGTVGGNGVGVVLLKRLEEALADNDAIHAVIRGAAVNNDGSAKVGYTAPSVEGQAQVIAMAQALAEVHPDSIGLVEAHGTGTPLGDPIEVAALTQVFRASTARSSYCALGSLKTNIGHLDCAAGVAGFIKAVLALEHAELPPSLHFQSPNPKLDLANSPFFVNTALQPWRENGTRRAAVSSFGIGGTNAHVILEEPPELPPSPPSRRYAVLPMSARSREALDAASHRLEVFLGGEERASTADIAFTAAVGRRAFPVRRAAVLETGVRPARAVASAGGLGHRAARQAVAGRKTVFMFPGQGAQHTGMGRDLFTHESRFKDTFERCAHLLRPELGVDLAQVVYGSDSGAHSADAALDQTVLTQPALFAVEYALAQVLDGYGIRPHAMIGHSIGEYVAACLAGVFTLEEALMLVAARGRLMQAAPPGRMLAVGLSEAEVAPFLAGGAELASVNGPRQSVLAGPPPLIEALASHLLAAGVQARLLATSHAFHSSMMTVAAAQFERVASRVAFNAPSRPFLSNLTGTWITPVDAMSPAYWAAQLRGTVRFGDALDRLTRMPEWMLLEVGPGTTLSALVRQHPSHRAEQPVVATMRHARDRKDDDRALMESVAELWASGVDVAWEAFYAGETRRRVHLPTYPFERQRYWIDAARPPAATASPSMQDARRPDVGAWLYRPVWTRRPLNPPVAARPSHWLVLADGPLAPALARHVLAAGHTVTTVTSTASGAASDYRVAPDSVDDYARVLDALDQQVRPPDVILHAWTADPTPPDVLAFYTLLPLGRALARRPARDVRLLVAATGLAAIGEHDAIAPERSTLFGPVTVIPQELPQVRCRAFDLGAVDTPFDADWAARTLIAEAALETGDALVAYRNGERWSREIVAIAPDAAATPSPVRSHGVWLITGGTGGIGLALAAHLARTVQARIVLVGRTALPDRAQWDDWCTSHDGRDRVRRAIEGVRAIEAAGGEVLTAAADVADVAQMDEVCRQARARFGAINAVIHAAGVAGGGMLQLKTPAMASRVLTPKVAGTYVLEQVLQNDVLDCLVLCSSLSSILGGFGQVDYCAANAFLDAYAHAAPARLRVSRSVSIDWDTWQETGMAVNTEVPRELVAVRDHHLRLGMTNAEGADVLMRALACPHDQIVVSTRDWQSRTAAAATVTPAPVAAAPQAGKHDRPALASAYVAPGSDAEAFVAATWSETLGIDRIGVHDDFFALGGHSLLAIQIAARLKEHFDADVPVQLIFDAPTVAELTARVQALVSDREGAGPQYADILEYVDQLSDEDVRRLLAASEGEQRP